MSTGAPAIHQAIFGKGTKPDTTKVDSFTGYDQTLPPKLPESALPGRLNEHVALPPEIVIVNVRAENDKYALTLHQGDSVDLDETSDKPKLAMLGNQRTPAAVRSSMVTLSEAQQPVRKLLKRLAKLRDKYETLCVVIVEHTSLGVPWEMAYCPKNRRHLGGLVSTVRLPPRDDDDDDDDENYPTKAPEVCAGGLAFLTTPDVSALKDGSVETHIQAMQARDAVGKRHFRNLPYLLKNEQPKNVALIYLLCHGGVDTLNVNDSWLGTLEPDGGEAVRITYERLNAMTPLRLFEASKSIVLINACAVGSVDAVDLSAANQPLGFPSMFLSQGARGVIGALHKVEVVHAAQLAEDLLELAKEHPSKPIPDLLRMLRESADEKLENALSDENADHLAALTTWYYTYLYVYYGDRRATLKLDEHRSDA